MTIQLFKLLTEIRLLFVELGDANNDHNVYQMTFLSSVNNKKLNVPANTVKDVTTRDPTSTLKNLISRIMLRAPSAQRNVKQRLTPSDYWNFF